MRKRHVRALATTTEAPRCRRPEGQKGDVPVPDIAIDHVEDFLDGSLVTFEDLAKVTLAEEQRAGYAELNILRA